MCGKCTIGALLEVRESIPKNVTEVVIESKELDSADAASTLTGDAISKLGRKNDA